LKCVEGLVVLAELKMCVAVCAQNKDALLFRLLPPPG
jgi:hypothetical protein